MLDPLLADTAPATIEMNARLKCHVVRMTAQWEGQTTPSPAPPLPQTAPAPPPPARAKTAHLHPPPPPSRERAYKSRRLAAREVADSGEILPRYGDFPRFAQMHQKTVLDTQEAAKWAFRLITADLKGATKAPKMKNWLIPNWCKELDGHHPPVNVDKFKNCVTGRFFHRSTCMKPQARATKVFEISRGSKNCNNGSRAEDTTGNVHQERFKEWAIQHVADSLQKFPEYRLCKKQLLEAFAALPETERMAITPYKPDHYFKVRPGFSMSIQLLYEAAERGRVGGGRRPGNLATAAVARARVGACGF
jgi:hypothetical protein